MFKLNNPEVKIFLKSKKTKRETSRKRREGSQLSALCRSPESVSFQPGVQKPEGVYLAFVNMEMLVCVMRGVRLKDHARWEDVSFNFSFPNPTSSQGTRKSQGQQPCVSRKSAGLWALPQTGDNCPASQSSREPTGPPKPSPPPEEGGLLR